MATTQGLAPEILQPGEGREMAWFAATMQVKTAADGMSAVEILVPQGNEPPMHVHSREDEWFYVLEGEVTFHVGDLNSGGGAGTFATFPVGIPHTFTVETPTARILMLGSPGGFERLFEARPTTPEEAVAALAGAGIEVVGPHPRELQR